MNKRIKGQKFTKATYKRGGYHWMSIKDRLPKLFSDVIVLIETIDGYHYIIDNTFFGVDKYGVWSFGTSSVVVAWMPMPSDPEIKSLINK